MNHPQATAAAQPEDIERIQKAMLPPETEIVRKQIEFLKLFDPDAPDTIPIRRDDD